MELFGRSGVEEDFGTEALAAEDDAFNAETIRRMIAEGRDPETGCYPPKGWARFVSWPGDGRWFDEQGNEIVERIAPRPVEEHLRDLGLNEAAVDWALGRGHDAEREASVRDQEALRRRHRLPAVEAGHGGGAWWEDLAEAAGIIDEPLVWCGCGHDEASGALLSDLLEGDDPPEVDEVIAQIDAVLDETRER